MFIIQLMGGLGNQMFQYAAARALSLERQVDFCIDFDCPYKHIEYEYELDKFRIEPKFANYRQLLYSKPKRKLLKRIYQLFGKNVECLLVKEKKYFHFDQSFFEVKDNSYFSGFWQTEKYFLKHADIIRKDFTFKLEPDEMNRNIINEMSSTNSVSIHIRRGDYVNFIETNAVHGVCSPKYYGAAIQLIKDKVENPQFYFFSDDIPWVKENLKFTDIKVTYIDHNKGPKSYEDLRLMQNCRHNIIANSSFSWWGAWLNSNPDKIVITPSEWVKDTKIEARDIIPEGWIKL